MTTIEHGGDATRPTGAGTPGTTGVGGTGGIAAQILDLVAPVFGGTVPFRVRAFDGSLAGPTDAPLVTVTTRDALRRLLWSPGELGLARAFAAGDLDVDGDLADSLELVWSALASRGSSRARPGGRAWLRMARAAGRLGALGLPPPAPASEARVAGRLHSRRRDRAIVAHHYDLSNAFYELLLDETMAYSCAYFSGPDQPLAAAQRAKLELVCTKLGIGPGTRLLDLGCGWGSLALHAAREHGATVTAVTLSGEQASYVRVRAGEHGLAGRVEVVQADYRDAPVDEHDAVSAIEMGEHVGRDGYPAFASLLASRLRPGGRVLVQQMSRPRSSPGGGPFIESYIAPDMHMRPVGETVALLERAGLEVRDVEAMREHYARTARAWYATLVENEPAAISLIGPERVRVWRLYLAGIAIGFERGSTGVDQILAVRPASDGSSGMAPGRAGWRP